MRLFSLFVLLCFMAINAQAQTVMIEQGEEVGVDSSKIKNPRKAALLSTAFPGLGQLYNQKYWKLPIVFGGVGALAYSAGFNYSAYQDFKSAYLAKIDNDESTIDPYPTVSQGAIQQQYQQYRKRFELSIIGLVALYCLNIVDATVDAHLSGFDVSDNLSFGLGSSAPHTQAPLSIGFNVHYTFK